MHVHTYIYSAGLAACNKNRSGKPISSSDEIFSGLYRIIQSEDFSNILTMVSKQRIDYFQYPQKMRSMQKYTVKDLSASDSLRKKVGYTLIKCQTL